MDKKILISFDIGIKNLAVCVLSATKGDNTAKILVWKIISLAEKKEKIPNLNELSGRLYTELDNITNDIGISSEIDTVLLENQPSRLNGTMKSIQMMIYSYYQMRRHWEGIVKNVHMVSASQKLLNHPYEIPQELLDTMKNKKPYEITKWKSVQITKKYIEDDEELKKLFDSYKKCDDMGDSCLQCISWLNKHHYDIKKLSS